MAASVFLVLLFWPQRSTIATTLTAYALLTLFFLTPFLVFVQATTGLTRYVMGIAPQIDEVSTAHINEVPIAFDVSAPLWIVHPPAERRINVRWSSEASDAQRREREARFRLASPIFREGTTWSYVPSDQTHTTITALIDDPLVDDTMGIDRSRGVVDLRESMYDRVRRALPMLRTEIAPGIFTQGNALAGFYYTTLLVPFIGLVVLVARLLRGQISRPESAVAGMTIVLSIIIVQTLVRDFPSARLPDVTGPVCVVGAWLAANWVGADWKPLAPLWRKAMAIAFLLFVVWSVGTHAQAGARLAETGILSGPAGVWHQFVDVRNRFRKRPIDSDAAGQPGLPRLTRYVFACTQDTDRLLVTWFAPEVFFNAERGFAGGQVYLLPGWHASAADQALTVERLARQRVPVILTQEHGSLAQDFPIVYAYVHERYTDAPMTAPDVDGYRVLVNTSLTPTGTYEPLGLPCYR